MAMSHLLKMHYDVTIATLTDEKYFFRAVVVYILYLVAWIMYGRQMVKSSNGRLASLTEGGSPHDPSISTSHICILDYIEFDVRNLKIFLYKSI